MTYYYIRGREGKTDVSFGDGVCLPRILSSTYGYKTNVIGVGDKPCFCGLNHTTNHYSLSNGLAIVACHGRFLWYKCGAQD